MFTLTQKLLPLLRAAAAASRQGETYSDPARIINVCSVVFFLDLSDDLDRIHRLDLLKA